MSYADDLKLEVEVLTKKIADLDTLRVERDHVVKHKNDTEKEIVDLTNMLAGLQKEVEHVRKTKAEIEAKKNNELDTKHEQIKAKEVKHAEIEGKHKETEAEHAARQAKMERHEAELAHKGESLAQREKNATEQERGIIQVKKDHEIKVAEFSQKTAQHDMKERKLFEIERLCLEKMNLIENENKKIDAEWNLIHKAIIECDHERASLETMKMSIESANENLKKGAVNISAQWVKLDQKEQELKNKNAEIEKMLSDHKALADGLTLRELECQSKERALEKRERIIILKEQNGGQ